MVFWRVLGIAATTTKGMSFTTNLWSAPQEANTLSAFLQLGLI
jgi:hypothetical protein